MIGMKARLQAAARGWRTPIRLDWQAAQTHDHHPKAIGTGDQAGQVLYGDRALAALRGHESPDVPTEGMPEIPAGDGSDPVRAAGLFHKVAVGVAGVMAKLSVPVANLVPVILDTADDWASMRASAYGNVDAWKAETGVSWAVTQAIVREAIGLAFRMAGKGAQKMSRADGPEADAALQVLTAALTAAWQPVGGLSMADVESLRRMLTERLGMAPGRLGIGLGRDGQPIKMMMEQKENIPDHEDYLDDHSFPQDHQAVQKTASYFRRNYGAGHTFVDRGDARAAAHTDYMTNGYAGIWNGHEFGDIDTNPGGESHENDAFDDLYGRLIKHHDAFRMNPEAYDHGILGTDLLGLARDSSHGNPLQGLHMVARGLRDHHSSLAALGVAHLAQKLRGHEADNLPDGDSASGLGWTLAYNHGFHLPDHPEAHQLLDHAVQNPDDAAPWLVYSDWLDEHGYPRTAGHIRDAIPRQHRMSMRGRLRAAVRMAKGGQPVRLSKDVEELHAAVADDPTRRARWYILADALGEAGKPWAAHLAKKLAAANPKNGVQYSSPDSTKLMFSNGSFNLGQANGEIAGMPIHLYPHSSGAWHAQVVHPKTGDLVGIANLEDPYHGQGLLHEMEPSLPEHAEQLNRLRSHFPIAPDARDHGIAMSRVTDRLRLAVRMARDPNKPHKYACALVSLTGRAATAITDLAATIPDADLADDGREDKPHVTIFFGLHFADDLIDKVKEVAKAFGRPIKGKLTALTAFLGEESDKDFDVLKYDVESHDLHVLHGLLAALPHTTTHPEYHPHATVCYVKAGKAKDYTGGEPLDLEFEVDPFTLSDESKAKHPVKLHRQIRLSRDDVHGMIAAVHENRDDAAPKLILADALQEIGHTGVADVLRHSVGHTTDPMAMRNPFTGGFARPLPFDLWKDGMLVTLSPRMSTTTDPAVADAIRSVGRGRYRGVQVHVQGEISPGWWRTIATHDTHSPDLIHRLVTELGPVPWGSIRNFRKLHSWLAPVMRDGEFKNQYTALSPGLYGRPPAPEKLSMSGRLRQAVRMARGLPIRLMRDLDHFLSQAYDLGSWDVNDVEPLASYLEEQGRPWTAEAVRRHAAVKAGYPHPLDAKHRGTAGLEAFTEGYHDDHPNRDLANAHLRVGVMTRLEGDMGRRHVGGMRHIIGLSPMVRQADTYNNPKSADHLFDTNDHNLARGLLHEFDRLGTGDPGEHAMKITQIQRREQGGAKLGMRDKVRQAVRMARADSPAILANLQESPLDRGALGVLADSFRDDGLDAHADILHKIATEGRPAAWTYPTPGRYLEYAHPDVVRSGVDTGRLGGQHVVSGHVHGVWVLIRKVDGESVPGHEGRFTDYRPTPFPMADVTFGDRGYRDMGSATIPLEHARPLVHELIRENPDWQPNVRPPHPDSPAGWAEQLAGYTRDEHGNPAKMRRGTPARLAAADGHLTTAQQLHAEIAANPLDRGAWAALADHLGEAGKPWLGHFAKLMSEAKDSEKANWISPNGVYRQEMGPITNEEDIPQSQWNDPLYTSVAGSVSGIPVMMRHTPPSPGKTGFSHVHVRSGPWPLSIHTTRGMVVGMPGMGEGILHEMDSLDDKSYGDSEDGRRRAAENRQSYEVLKAHYPTPPNPSDHGIHMRRGTPARLAAQADRPIAAGNAADRAGSANHQDLLGVLRNVLTQSGLTPHKIYPAIHDVANQARASAVAAVFGERARGAANYGAAWQGLLSKTPNLVVFRSHPDGGDSVYRFGFKGPQQAMSGLLDSIGVTNRVYVPQGDTTHVFLYDRGRKNRDAIGQLAGSMGLEVTEHTGSGQPVGGGDEDNGRGAYRDEVRAAEGQQQPAHLSRLRRAIHLARTGPDTPGLISQVANGNQAARSALSFALHGHHAMPTLGALVNEPSQPGPQPNETKTFGSTVLRGGTALPLRVGFHLHPNGAWRVSVADRDNNHIGHYWTDSGKATQIWREFSPHTRGVKWRDETDPVRRAFGETDHNNVVNALNVDDVGLPRTVAVIPHGPPAHRAAGVEDLIKTKPEVVKPVTAPHPDDVKTRRDIGRLQQTGGPVRLEKNVPEDVYDPWIRDRVRSNLTLHGHDPETVPGHAAWEKDPVTRYVNHRAGHQAADVLHAIALPDHPLYAHLKPGEDFQKKFWSHVKYSVMNQGRGGPVSAGSAPEGTPAAALPKGRPADVDRDTYRREQVRGATDDHPGLVMGHVRKNPGVTWNDLLTATRLTSPLQRAAVDRLVAGGAAKTFREYAGQGKHRERVFPADHPIPEGMVPSRMDQVAAMKQQGLSHSEVAKKLGISVAAVGFSYRRAINRGIVPPKPKLSRAGRPVRFAAPINQHEAEPFLRAMADAPHDVAPRLAFSDWLEERELPHLARMFRDPQPNPSPTWTHNGKTYHENGEASGRFAANGLKASDLLSPTGDANVYTNVLGKSGRPRHGYSASPLRPHVQIIVASHPWRAASGSTPTVLIHHHVSDPHEAAGILGELGEMKAMDSPDSEHEFIRREYRALPADMLHDLWPAHPLKLRRTAQSAQADPNAAGDSDPEADAPYVPVSSSWIAGLAGKPDGEVDMTVAKTGKTYAYHGLPPGTLKEWLRAASKGKFFNTAIRPRG